MLLNNKYIMEVSNVAILSNLSNKIIMRSFTINSSQLYNVVHYKLHAIILVMRYKVRIWNASMVYFLIDFLIRRFSLVSIYKKIICIRKRLVRNIQVWILYLLERRRRISYKKNTDI